MQVCIIQTLVPIKMRFQLYQIDTKEDKRRWATLVTRIILLIIFYFIYSM